MKHNSRLKTKDRKKRLGRGIGSGKGKTSGRGVKGQSLEVVLRQSFRRSNAII